ncbi:MAG: hypothetical protein ACRDTX_28205 [Pseudonocardiaceae bacterium]
MRRGPELAALPVGHPARPVATRALWVSIAVAGLFTVLAHVSTRLHVVRAGSPWQDDPYDALVSLTEFLATALAAATGRRRCWDRSSAVGPAHRGWTQRSSC